ncbi:formyltetrahydrofolate deformylase [Pontimonas sp.]|nr:formyltetrahydrofolate deformylase [Pontimonas sp.]MDA8887412.1 formyltetrahydrofolate deformylase [Pontimonas sp.]
MPSSPSHFVVTFVCDDKPGIVHAVSGAIVEAKGNITESQQFSSEDTGRFFMRVQVETTSDYASFQAALGPVIERYDMTTEINTVGRPLRTLILASSAGHCLTDLLVRQRDGHLTIDIPQVLSNHDALEPVAKFYGVPFRALPITDQASKAQFEAEVLALVEKHDIGLVVLARYMQIVSPELCTALEGRMINIHHSFLPGFKGASPYRQAHERGVKLIGATAHFVTTELDEGPIIEQNVVRVDHSHSAEELRAIGQDEESRTLTQAVRWFAEHRILLDGVRTIIFK